MDHGGQDAWRGEATVYVRNYIAILTFTQSIVLKESCAFDNAWSYLYTQCALMNQ
jgi:hypothetical protein